MVQSLNQIRDMDDTLRSLGNFLKDQGFLSEVLDLTARHKPLGHQTPARNKPLLLAKMRVLALTKGIPVRQVAIFDR